MSHLDWKEIEIRMTVGTAVPAFRSTDLSIKTWNRVGALRVTMSRLATELTALTGLRFISNHAASRSTFRNTSHQSVKVAAHNQRGSTKASGVYPDPSCVAKGCIHSLNKHSRVA